MQGHFGILKKVHIQFQEMVYWKKPLKQKAGNGEETGVETTKTICISHLPDIKKGMMKIEKIKNYNRYFYHYNYYDNNKYLITKK